MEQELEVWRKALPIRFGGAISVLICAACLWVFVALPRMGLLILIPSAVWCAFYAYRNVFGRYACWFYIGTEGEIKWHICKGKLWDGLENIGGENLLRIPLGNWFRQPAIVSLKHKDNLAGMVWGIKVDGWHAYWSPAELRLRLLDKHDGGNVVLSPANALLLSEKYMGLSACARDVILLAQRESCESALARELFRTLAETAKRIADAKRFVRSQQAKNIREWLEGRLKELDPNWYPKSKPDAGKQ